MVAGTPLKKPSSIWAAVEPGSRERGWSVRVRVKVKVRVCLMGE